MSSASDYEKLESILAEIKERERYKDAILVKREDIEKAKEEIKEEINSRMQVDDRVLEEYIYKHFGLGKLAPLLLDERLEEIMVIGNGSPVYVVDRKEGKKSTEIYLSGEESLGIVQRIAGYVGRKIDASHPLLDARLPDGSRVNATLSKVTPKGTSITIRKFTREPLTVLHLLRYKTLDPRLTAFLWLAVHGLDRKPANILIMGGTATGKTTTLNALTSFIPEDKRIISIEDTLEISIRHKHWIPMEAGSRTRESEDEMTMDMLLKNALRMRPDRIILGEVRGEEARTLFTAMNTGHDGCIATIHANSPRETLARLRGPPMDVPDMMIPALDLIVAQKSITGRDGKLRRIVFEVTEISGKEGETFLTNTLFSYDPKTDRVESKILNGKIVREISESTGLTIKEIDEEIHKRELVLELMMQYDLTQKDIHKFVQDYYRQKYDTLKNLHDEIVALLEAREGTAADAKKTKAGIARGKEKKSGLINLLDEINDSPA